MPSEPELKGPWTARVDPDGPTEILNAEGKVVATVEPKYAALFVLLPELIVVPRTVVEIGREAHHLWMDEDLIDLGEILKALAGLPAIRGHRDADAIFYLRERIKESSRAE